MKNHWLIILLVMLLSACSSTHLIKKNVALLKELNEDLEGEEVTIDLLNGNVIIAENVIISEDSSSWLELKLSYGFWVPIDSCRTSTSDIKSISYKNNSKSAWEWMGYGTLIGLGTGALIGWQATAGERMFSMRGDGMSAEPIGIAIGGLVGLTSGLIIGPAFGAIVGHRETYIMNEPVDKYLTLEIKSILEETKQSIFFEWENKIIHMPKSEIIEKIKINNKIYFRVDEITYITYFK